MARFVPFVRTFAPFAAGIGKMNYNRFFFYDLFGGFLWVFSLTIAGYLLGEVEWIRKHIDLVCLGIIFISVLPMLIEFIKAKRIKVKLSKIILEIPFKNSVATSDGNFSNCATSSKIFADNSIAVAFS